MKLYNIVKNYKLNQADIAKHVGVSEQYFSAILTGKIKCNEKLQIKISEFLKQTGRDLSSMIIDF